MHVDIIIYKSIKCTRLNILKYKCNFASFNIMFLSKSVKSEYIYVAVYKCVEVFRTYLLYIYIYKHPPIIIKYGILLACILPEKALH